jgi:hypothetical protein
MNWKPTIAIAALVAATTSESVLAYVGPGAGLSLLGALWGLLVAVAAALAFIILWPMRRMLRQRAGARGAGADERDDRSERGPDKDRLGSESH